MVDPYETIPQFIDSEDEPKVRLVMKGGGEIEVVNINPKYVINNGKIFMEEGVFEFEYSNLRDK